MRVLNQRQDQRFEKPWSRKDIAIQEKDEGGPGFADPKVPGGRGAFRGLL